MPEAPRVAVGLAFRPGTLLTTVSSSGPTAMASAAASAATNRPDSPIPRRSARGQSTVDGGEEPELAALVLASELPAVSQRAELDKQPVAKKDHLQVGSARRALRNAAGLPRLPAAAGLPLLPMTGETITSFSHDPDPPSVLVSSDSACLCACVRVCVCLCVCVSVCLCVKKPHWTSKFQSIKTEAEGAPPIVWLLKVPCAAPRSSSVNSSYHGIAL